MNVRFSYSALQVLFFRSDSDQLEELFLVQHFIEPRKKISSRAQARKLKKTLIFLTQTEITNFSFSLFFLRFKDFFYYDIGETNKIISTIGFKVTYIPKFQQFFNLREMGKGGRWWGCEKKQHVGNHPNNTFTKFHAYWTLFR